MAPTTTITADASNSKTCPHPPFPLPGACPQCLFPSTSLKRLPPGRDFYELLLPPYLQPRRGINPPPMIPDLSSGENTSRAYHLEMGTGMRDYIGWEKETAAEAKEDLKEGFGVEERRLKEKMGVGGRVRRTPGMGDRAKEIVAGIGTRHGAEDEGRAEKKVDPLLVMMQMMRTGRPTIRLVEKEQEQEQGQEQEQEQEEEEEGEGVDSGQVLVENLRRVKLDQGSDRDEEPIEASSGIPDAVQLGMESNDSGPSLETSNHLSENLPPSPRCILELREYITPSRRCRTHGPSPLRQSYEPERPPPQTPTPEIQRQQRVLRQKAEAARRLEIIHLRRQRRRILTAPLKNNDNHVLPRLSAVNAVLLQKEGIQENQFLNGKQRQVSFIASSPAKSKAVRFQLPEGSRNGVRGYIARDQTPYAGKVAKNLPRGVNEPLAKAGILKSALKLASQPTAAPDGKQNAGRPTASRKPASPKQNPHHAPTRQTQQQEVVNAARAKKHQNFGDLAKQRAAERKAAADRIAAEKARRLEEARKKVEAEKQRTAEARRRQVESYKTIRKVAVESKPVAAIQIARPVAWKRTVPSYASPVPLRSVVLVVPTLGRPQSRPPVFAQMEKPPTTIRSNQNHSEVVTPSYYRRGSIRNQPSIPKMLRIANRSNQTTELLAQIHRNHALMLTSPHLKSQLKYRQGPLPRSPKTSRPLQSPSKNSPAAKGTFDSPLTAPIARLSDSLTHSIYLPPLPPIIKSDKPILNSSDIPVYLRRYSPLISGQSFNPHSPRPWTLAVLERVQPLSERLYYGWRVYHSYGYWGIKEGVGEYRTGRLYRLAWRVGELDREWDECAVDWEKELGSPRRADPDIEQRGIQTPSRSLGSAKKEDGQGKLTPMAACNRGVGDEGERMVHESVLYGAKDWDYENVREERERRLFIGGDITETETEGDDAETDAETDIGTADGTEELSLETIN